MLECSNLNLSIGYLRIGSIFNSPPFLSTSSAYTPDLSNFPTFLSHEIPVPGRMVYSLSQLFPDTLLLHIGHKTLPPYNQIKSITQSTFFWWWWGVYIEFFFFNIVVVFQSTFYLIVTILSLACVDCLLLWILKTLVWLPVILFSEWHKCVWH